MPQGPVVTMGVFDGVHIGHQDILRRMAQCADKRGVSPLLISFHPHPRKLLSPDWHNYLLQTLEEKIDFLASKNLCDLLLLPFTPELAATPPADFIKHVLVDALATQEVFVGYDHQFGKQRGGDATLLRHLGAEYGFAVSDVRAVRQDNSVVSSSAIREHLRKGQLAEANAMLGYRYSISGLVVRGNQVGRKIGFPTANLEPGNPDKLIPSEGVYATITQMGGRNIKGMTNIGYRPTINQGGLTIETYLFDFDEDIYGQPLVLNFVAWLRNEQRFQGIEALKVQLATDQINAREQLKSER